MPPAPATAAGRRSRLAPFVPAFALFAALCFGLWAGPVTAPAEAATQSELPAELSAEAVPHPEASVQAGDASPAASPPPVLSGYKAAPANGSIAEIAHIRSAWERILAEHDPQVAFVTGQHLPEYTRKQWKNLTALLPGQDRAKQLRYINGFFNNLPSQKDILTYGQDDYWATPEEFMRAGAGDCEDYAIAKYLALKHFGWPPDGMWILLVMRLENKEHHAVLAVQNGKTLFVLDNLSRPAYLLVPQETFMKAFVPLFALNERGFWFFTRQ